MKNHIKTNEGFTLIELLIVITIGLLIVGGSFVGYSSMVGRSYLDARTYELMQSIRQAQLNSVARLNNSQWGVHIDPDLGGNNDNFVIFKGSTYVGRDSAYDTATALPDNVSISSVSLSDSGTDIIFDLTTGEPAQYGSITFTDNQGGSNTININNFGIVSL